VPPSIRGKKIVELREAAGFKTQGALATAARMDPSKVSKLENDKAVNLTLKTIERLATTLKVNPGELFEDTRPGEPGHGDTAAAADERNSILEHQLEALDVEVPAEDSWRGDVLKAVAVLNRALRRPDTGTATETTSKARR